MGLIYQNRFLSKSNLEDVYLLLIILQKLYKSWYQTSSGRKIFSTF